MRWLPIAFLSNCAFHCGPSRIRTHKKDCVACSISSVAETRDRALSFSREMDFIRWFSVAFLTNGVFIVTHRGIELRSVSPHAQTLHHGTYERVAPGYICWASIEQPYCESRFYVHARTLLTIVSDIYI